MLLGHFRVSQAAHATLTPSIRSDPVCLVRCIEEC